MEFFSPKRSLSVFISFDIFKCHGVLDIVEVVSKFQIGFKIATLEFNNEYFEFRMPPEPSATAAPVD